jgi:predicted transposase YdaD
VTRLGPDAEKVYTTIADMIEERGLARGRAEGQAEGRAEGRAEILADQLTHKFGTLSASARSRVRAASAEELALWARRVLHASSLDEVFG